MPRGTKLRAGAGGDIYLPRTRLLAAIRDAAPGGKGPQPRCACSRARLVPCPAGGLCWWQHLWGRPQQPLVSSWYQFSVFFIFTLNLS